MTDNLIERTLDRAIERLQSMSTYAGRPTWEDILREELSGILKAKDAEIERLKEALKPFAERDWTDDEGWTEVACEGDRIVDWFGPSDFRAARKALGGRDGE